MTEHANLDGTDTAVINRAVWVEPTGVDSTVVRERVLYESGEEVETETPFTSLSEALAYASKLCRDDSSEEIEILE
jgi:hypothetical protein